MRSHDPAALDALLAEDVVFESPVVHTPQRGKAVTTRYLSAAAEVLGRASFRYLDEWFSERSAVLEFACDLGGISVNGVDMIWWNDADRITGFKVMIRPLKAINAVHQAMGAKLARA
jgi:hypothetical protein